MSEQEPATARKRTKGQQFWQLHVPLVVWLGICAFATVVVYNRALDGSERAWNYTIQWPLFGVFAIFLWWRLLNEKSVTKSIVEFYKKRTEQISAEAADPELKAWNEYVRELKDQEQEVKE
jgi:hypothetical protein